MTEIKICGITCLEDAMAAADCGVNAIGFIFHEPSPRWIDPIQAGAIVKALAGRVATAGVFVNRKADEVERIVAATGSAGSSSTATRQPSTAAVFRRSG